MYVYSFCRRKVACKRLKIICRTVCRNLVIISLADPFSCSSGYDSPRESTINRCPRERREKTSLRQRGLNSQTSPLGQPIVGSTAVRGITAAATLQYKQNLDMVCSPPSRCLYQSTLSKYVVDERAGGTTGERIEGVFLSRTLVVPVLLS